MVFLKLLGLADLSAVLSLLLFNYGVIPQKIIIIFVVYLAIKSMIFFKDLASLIDLGAVIVFSLVLFGMFNALTWIAMIWVFQKAIFSLLG